ncbi:nucleotide-binding protein [Pyxidicoccus parkwayensis]|uniref:Nucleotide-binding protein n=1 Tax=Pyxidicoccus parkwayensis TaxID=2813578 RepID=A0ABX7NL95_9BACT|nr:TIR domain-containing protein [Pyxidicoccus parkwaysis]QSQ19183.1 nucleotide-binding protein [Pyxidicoccus parkwaysis]
MATKKKPSLKKTEQPMGKRTYFKQADFPLFTLQDAQRVAAALVDDFGGKEGSPPDVAISMGVSPASSTWRDLAGAAIAYNLTEGGSNASVIKLLPLGKKLVAPEAEGEDIAARREAVMKPRIVMEFFEKYRRAKFPGDVIAVNVLKSLGMPPDRASTALDILKANGRYAGIIRDTPTGAFINLDSPSIPGPSVAMASGSSEAAGIEAIAPAAAPEETQPASASFLAANRLPPADMPNRRVFITHGKQKAIVSQIKELLSFGSFEPIVSVERESTAIPVPEKVFEDMRGCVAGVIHVGAEGKYLDRDGGEHTKINDNVLIEIGAAMALYGKKVILLVERGVSLPSNLQGLYRCEFEGDRLDYESTMKLLKTFNQFR